MRSEELKTFAINTGKFYQQHIDMATEVASLRVWELHIRVNVLPEYRRAHHEPYDGLTIAEISEVATELQHYYSQHVGEMDA